MTASIRRDDGTRSSIERGLQAALRDAEAAAGPGSPAAMTARRELADYYFDARRWDDAAAQYKALQRAEEGAFGSEHLAVSRTLLRLGECDLERRYHPRAERRLRQSLGIRQRRLGDGHPALTRPEAHLAAVRVRLGHAEEGIERLPADLRRQDEPEDLVLAKSYRTLARALTRHGEVDRATFLYERVARIYQRRLPAGHVRVGECFRDLGFCLLRRGLHRQAEGPLRLALDAFRDARKPDDPRVAKLEHWLGVALTGQARYDEALVCLRRALEMTGRISGVDSAAYAELLQCVGNLHRAMGNFRWAERFLRHSLSALEVSAGFLRRETLKVVADLGRCLAEQGRAGEARTLFKVVVGRIRERYGASHPALPLYARAYQGVMP